MDDSEKRKIRLSDLLIQRPCNDAQRDQNWQKVFELFRQLDYFFKIHQEPGEDHWHLCLVNLDCLDAKQIRFQSAADRDFNLYKINYDPSHEPALKSFRDFPDEQVPVLLQQYDDDSGDYIVVFQGAPPPPPPPPEFNIVYLDTIDQNIPEDLIYDIIDDSGDYATVFNVPEIEFRQEYLYIDDFVEQEIPEYPPAPEFGIIEVEEPAGYCECAGNCCLFQWDEFIMSWNLIDPNGCEINPPNPPPGGSCMCVPPARSGNFHGEQAYGSCQPV